jgi:hypothetical protein
MKNDYSYSFETSRAPGEIFDTLLDVKAWWSGLYGEDISGSSRKLNDEFTFRAGAGVHETTQRLVELIPNQKISWLVTESNLTFLEKKDEWTNTHISFDISKKGDKTQVTFTHEGLVPRIECYNGCAGAWTQYMDNLAARMR